MINSYFVWHTVLREIRQLCL